MANFCPLIFRQAYTRVSADELVKLKDQWSEPKCSAWYYRGSSARYHFFVYHDLEKGAGFVRKRYKVSRDSFKLRIPLSRVGTYRLMDTWGAIGLRNSDT